MPPVLCGRDKTIDNETTAKDIIEAMEAFAEKLIKECTE